MDADADAHAVIARGLGDARSGGAWTSRRAWRSAPIWPTRITQHGATLILAGRPNEGRDGYDAFRLDPRGPCVSDGANRWHELTISSVTMWRRIGAAGEPSQHPEFPNTIGGSQRRSARSAGSRKHGVLDKAIAAAPSAFGLCPPARALASAGRLRPHARGPAQGGMARLMEWPAHAAVASGPTARRTSRSAHSRTPGSGSTR